MQYSLLSLGLVLALVLAGCTAGGPVGETSEPTETPEPLETPTPKPLPDRPEDPSRETVLEFASAYEEAYKWNAAVEAETIELRINPVRAEIQDSTANGYVVHLEVGISHTRRSDGDKMVGDGFYTVNYYVDESTIMRAETGGQARPGPDPRNGTTLEG